MISRSIICALAILLCPYFITGEAEVRRSTMVLDEAPCTSGPMGLESGAIPDSSITASSFYHVDYKPEKARLNVGTAGWIPSAKEDQWIQVDLGEYTAITGVIVQGYRTTQHVKTFGVQYSSTGDPTDWQNLADEAGAAIELNGNTGSGSPVTVIFPAVLMARYLRILPLTWKESAPYALRFEVLGCRDGLVRLVDGETAWSGRVEVYRHGSWGAVCDRDWNLTDARAVCRQLGFRLGALEAKGGSFFGDSGGLPTVMSRVTCKGTEARLADCPFICGDHRGCGRAHEAGVICRPNTIRLVGGLDPASGRVEIQRDGAGWGTICDNDWDAADGRVVCRQLGFPGVLEAWPGAHFGPGQGPVHMDGVACDGTEDKITDCPSLCWEEESACDHTHDVGVVCQQGDFV